jgi:E3 ubiquitin-protein ligase MARCH6
MGAIVIAELKEGRPEPEIQTQPEEPGTTAEFTAIWRRANSNPEEVLRIIERENKGYQMRHWVNAMRTLQNRSPP